MKCSLFEYIIIAFLLLIVAAICSPILIVAFSLLWATLVITWKPLVVIGIIILIAQWVDWRS